MEEESTIRNVQEQIWSRVSDHYLTTSFIVLLITRQDEKYSVQAWTV